MIHYDIWQQRSQYWPSWPLNKLLTGSQIFRYSSNTRDKCSKTSNYPFIDLYFQIISIFYSIEIRVLSNVPFLVEIEILYFWPTFGQYFFASVSSWYHIKISPLYSIKTFLNIHNVQYTSLPCFSNTPSGLYYLALTLRLLSDWSSYEWKKGSHDKCPFCESIIQGEPCESSHDIMPKSIDQDGEPFGALHDTSLYLLWWSIDLLHDWVMLISDSTYVKCDRL